MKILWSLSKRDFINVIVVITEEVMVARGIFTYNIYTFGQLETKSVKINKIEKSLFPLHSVCIAYQKREFQASSLCHATLQANFFYS